MITKILFTTLVLICLVVLAQGSDQANVTTSMLCDHADQDGDDSSADENKQHESELSETSDIEMLDIDEEDGEDGHAISTTEASKEPTV